MITFFNKRFGLSINMDRSAFAERFEVLTLLAREIILLNAHHFEAWCRLRPCEQMIGRYIRKVTADHAQLAQGRGQSGDERNGGLITDMWVFADA